MCGISHPHAAGKISAILALPDDFELVGVSEPIADLRRKRQAHPKFQHVRWLDEDTLFSESDAILVETQPAAQVQTAQRAIEAGLHVHLEKPGGESFPEFSALMQSAKANNLHVQMGYMLRHNPAFELCFRLVREEVLGRVFEVTGSMSKLSDDQTRHELARYPGGAMFELGCHLIDALLTVLGPPTRVVPHLRETQDDGLRDNCLAVFEYPQALATIRSSLVEPHGQKRRRFVVSGEYGTLAICPLEPPRARLTLIRAATGFAPGVTDLSLPASPGRYHEQLQRFASVIRKERAPEWDAEHDLAVHRAVLEASGMCVSSD